MRIKEELQLILFFNDRQGFCDKLIELKENIENTKVFIAAREQAKRVLPLIVLQRFDFATRLLDAVHRDFLEEQEQKFKRFQFFLSVLDNPNILNKTFGNQEFETKLNLVRNLNPQDLLDSMNIIIRNKQCICPFHEEKTPSCHVYSDHIHCFGCGFHGDTIAIYQKVFDTTFKEAVEKLYNL